MLAVNGTLTILLSNGSLNQLLLKLCLQVLRNVESTNFSRSSTHLCIPLLRLCHDSSSWYIFTTLFQVLWKHLLQQSGGKNYDSMFYQQL